MAIPIRQKSVTHKAVPPQRAPGGFRHNEGKKVIGSLVLALTIPVYCITAASRPPSGTTKSRRSRARVEKLIAPPGFDRGKTDGLKVRRSRGATSAT